LIALPLVFLSLGMAWFLSSLGVFIRDINHSVALIVQVLFFITPIFYPSEAIPDPYRMIISFNPLATIVENFRRVILWGVLPNWTYLAFSLIVTGTLMVFGYAWFMKTKKAFADVI
jgi:lipopolysaccharide transport system permease protein